MSADKGAVGDQNRQLRQNLRNYLLTASEEEAQKEIKISRDQGDETRAKIIEELISEGFFKFLRRGVR